MEINMPADTVCAGESFEEHQAMGKIVDVNGFHNSLNTLTHIKVVTAITTIDLDGETNIGVFQ